MTPGPLWDAKVETKKAPDTNPIREIQERAIVGTKHKGDQEEDATDGNDQPHDRDPSRNTPT